MIDKPLSEASITEILSQLRGRFTDLQRQIDAFEKQGKKPHLYVAWHPKEGWCFDATGTSKKGAIYRLTRHMLNLYPELGNLAGEPEEKETSRLGLSTESWQRRQLEAVARRRLQKDGWTARGARIVAVGEDGEVKENDSDECDVKRS